VRADARSLAKKALIKADISLRLLFETCEDYDISQFGIYRDKQMYEIECRPLIKIFVNSYKIRFLNIKWFWSYFSWQLLYTSLFLAQDDWGAIQIICDTYLADFVPPRVKTYCTYEAKLLCGWKFWFKTNKRNLLTQCVHSENRDKVKVRQIFYILP